MEYTLSRPNHGRTKQIIGRPCNRCGKPFVEGDDIESRPSRHGINKKIYHLACWDGMRID
ncbi:MAG: hypothetical protein ABSA75_07470 [Candidatus Bathyarchaeia archaeon]